MDTGTHLVIGVGMAGLAQIDPVVAADPITANAVLVGTVLGSQAPDSDGLLRMFGNSRYIRNHRGLSHSLPAVLLWAGLITCALPFAFGPLPMTHVFFWVLAAVAFHVFTDLFNAYGTQAFRPFSEKWVAWNVIHIFDPFIFFSHLTAIAIWVLGLAEPAGLFSLLYAIIALYYVWRSLLHRKLEKDIAARDPDRQDGDVYTVLPTVNLNVWNVVKRRKDGSYVLGEWKSGAFEWVDTVSGASHPAVEASKRSEDVQAFLYYSSFAWAEVKEYAWGYEVRWADARYRHRKQYPFVAVVHLDRNLQPIDSYVGWLSPSRLEKKLRMNTN